MEKARCNTELYSNLRAPLENVKPSNFLGSHHMVTDLLNNKIGRRIGAMYPGSSRKELALRVLEEYWRNGLYSYEQGRDGRWYVQKKRIPDNVFYDLYNKYKKLNKFGR